MTEREILSAAGATTPQEAFDEAMRELDVRSRCYPKWLKEGKISHTDCTTRFRALAKVVVMLGALPGVTTNATESSTEWKPF